MLENAQQMTRRTPADGALPKRRRRVGELDARTMTARRVKELTEGFVAALGGNPDALTMAAIMTAAETTALAEAARRAALCGTGTDALALVRLQGTADRAVRRLGLPKTQREPVHIPLRARLAADVADALAEANEGRDEVTS